MFGDEDANKGRRETEHTHTASYGRVKGLMHKKPKYQALSAALRTNEDCSQEWLRLVLIHADSTSLFSSSRNPLSTKNALQQLKAVH